MVFLPFAPNWRSPVTMGYQFKTEILQARSGKEQRRALRSTPRRSIDCEVLLDNDAGRERLRLLRDNQHLPVQLSEPARATRTAQALASSARAVSVQRVPPWLLAGAPAALQDGRRVVPVMVQSVSGSNVTLAAATGETWPAGALLCPVSTGHVDSDATIRMETAGVGVLALHYVPEPATEAKDYGTPGTLFEGLEVLALRPNWTERPTAVLARPVERVDYDRGRVAYYTPIDFGSRTLQARYLGRTTADAEAIVQFFARQRGRRGEFFAPSFIEDMRAVSGLNPGSSSIAVAGAGTSLSWPTEKVNRVVAVVNPAGRVALSRVSNVSRSGETSVLALATPVPANYDMSRGAMLCWAARSRFASDDLTIEHLTQTTTQFVLNRVTLPDE